MDKDSNEALDLSKSSHVTQVLPSQALDLSVAFPVSVAKSPMKSQKPSKLFQKIQELQQKQAEKVKDFEQKQAEIRGDSTSTTGAGKNESETVVSTAQVESSHSQDFGGNEKCSVEEKPFGSYKTPDHESSASKRKSPKLSPQNPLIEIDILQGEGSRPSSVMSVTSTENPTIELNFQDVGSVSADLVRDEDSNMSAISLGSKEESQESKDSEEITKSKPKKTPARKRNPDLTFTQLTGGKDGFSAEQLFEYKWPQEGRGEWYMIQEQVSEYLEVKSFKRKYPDLTRRNIEPQERVYLREKGVVTEMQADLGLTIVKADLIHDLMSKDYMAKYKEYLTVVKERKKQQVIQRNKELQAQKADQNSMANLKERAIKSTVAFNAMFNRERREERKAFFDVHTFEVQFPYDKRKVLPPHLTKVGAYPVALIPGQFQNYYKKYSTDELNYMPLNTAVYSSPRKPLDMYADPAPGSDGEESQDDVSSESSEAASLVNSEGESMEIASDMFEDSDNEDSKDAATGKGEVGEEAEDDSNSQDGGGGKSKEEKKQEINRKVQEILDKLHVKESRKGKRGRPPMTEEMKKSRLELRLKQKAEAKAAELAGGSSEGSSASGVGSGKPDVPLMVSGLTSVPSTGSLSGTQSPGSGTSTPIRGSKRGDGRRSRKSKEVARCNICNGTEPEEMVKCAECSRYGHPSCLELTKEMIAIISTYPWQCMECKTCVKCKDAQHEDCMLFCDHCDRGYHTFCVGLKSIPNGRWECPSCLPQAVMIDPLTDSEVVKGSCVSAQEASVNAPNTRIGPMSPSVMLQKMPIPMLQQLKSTDLLPPKQPHQTLAHPAVPEPPSMMNQPPPVAPMPHTVNMIDNNQSANVNIAQSIGTSQALNPLQLHQAVENSTPQLPVIQTAPQTMENSTLQTSAVQRTLQASATDLSSLSSVPLAHVQHPTQGREATEPEVQNQPMDTA